MNKIINTLIVTICTVAISGICFFCTSCVKIFDYTVQGIGSHVSDEFNVVYWYLLPPEIETKYLYNDGDFYYYDNIMKGGFCIEYLRYNEEIYFEAKEYMLSHTDYTEEVHYSYNGYEFYENLKRPRENGELDENGMNTWGLYNCHFICYNDSKYTLVFTWVMQNDAKTCSQDDWGAFLKKYFPYYDFDA